MPFSVSLGVQIDALKNGGAFFVALFGKTLFSGRVFFKQTKECGSIVFEQKNKQREIRFTSDKEDENSFSAVLTRTLARSLNITKLSVEMKIGKRDDALFTTIALVGARIIACSALSVIKNAYGSEINDGYEAVYDKDIFVISVSGIIKVSIADIIFDTLRNLFAKIKRKGGEKVDYRS